VADKRHMNRLRDKQADRYTSIMTGRQRQAARHTGRQTDRQTDTFVDKQVTGRWKTDTKKDGPTKKGLKNSQKVIQADGWKNRQKERQAGNR